MTKPPAAYGRRLSWSRSVEADAQVPERAEVDGDDQLGRVFIDDGHGGWAAGDVDVTEVDAD